MRIVYIIDFLFSINAGTERQLHMLISSMVSRRHEVELYVLRDSDFTKNLSSFPCPVHCLNVISLMSLASCRRLLQFRQQMIAKRIDVIHGFFNDVALILPPLMIGTGIRTYTSRRDMGIWYTPSRLWILRLFRFSNTRLICNSLAVARFAQEKEWKPSDAIKVIYNGIGLFDPTKAQDMCDLVPGRIDKKEIIKVVLVANIRPVKRIEDLVRAAHHLNDGRNSIEYFVIGHLSDPEYHESLLTLLRQYKLIDNFHFIGSVSEPRAILSSFDIGVLTSESEGLSNSVIEYLDAGLPVVISNVGGNPELVTNGFNGFLYEKGDYKALAKCLQQLVNDDILRNKFSANAKSKDAMRQFDNLTMVNNHEVEYAQVD